MTQRFQVKYDYLLYTIGFLSSLCAYILLTMFDFGMLTALSLGANVALFTYAFTLHEGWHEIGESANQSRGVDTDG